MENHPELSYLILHEYRHIFGTILYHMGVPLDTIADVMGHADIQTTKEIYVHSTVEDARNRMDEAKQRYDKKYDRLDQYTPISVKNLYF